MNFNTAYVLIRYGSIIVGVARYYYFYLNFQSVIKLFKYYLFIILNLMASFHCFIFEKVKLHPRAMLNIFWGVRVLFYLFI